MPSCFDSEFWTKDPGNMNQEELWDHYKACLRRHDWTYNYSDDHGVWRHGVAQRDHLLLIRERVEELDEKTATELYNHHSPFLNDDGSLK